MSKAINNYDDDEESKMETANFFETKKSFQGSSYYEQCMLMTIDESGIDPIAYLKFNKEVKIELKS